MLKTWKFLEIKKKQNLKLIILFFPYLYPEIKNAAVRKILGKLRVEQFR